MPMKKKILLLLIIIFAVYDALVISMLVQPSVSGFWIWPTPEKSVETPKKGIEDFFIADSLLFLSKESVRTGQGTKSVLIDAAGSSVFAFNLEEMSVDEFERSSRRLKARLRFKATKAKGYNYTTHSFIESYAEKPVEGCLTHNGRFLWMSLHNAGGVVAWDRQGRAIADTIPHKTAMLQTDTSNQVVRLPFFATGSTPKFIIHSGDYLFVSNWHSDNVSVIGIAGAQPSDWQKVKDIKVGHVPRGMAVSEGLLLVGNMGQDNLSIVAIDSLKVIGKIQTGYTPRHLLARDTHVVVTLSSPEKILSLNLHRRRLLAQRPTCDDPRTLAYSEPFGIFFTVCYGSSELQAFSGISLKPLGKWLCAETPVGLAVYTCSDTIEAWIGHYKTGKMSIYRFKAKTTSGKGLQAGF